MQPIVEKENDQYGWRHHKNIHKAFQDYTLSALADLREFSLRVMTVYDMEVPGHDASRPY
jgi:hypothetical protein